MTFLPPLDRADAPPSAVENATTGTQAPPSSALGPVVAPLPAIRREVERDRENGAWDFPDVEDWR